MESNGAVNAHLIQLTYAGLASGLVALTCERARDTRAHARTGAAWMSDEGMAIQMKSMDGKARASTSKSDSRVRPIADTSDDTSPRRAYVMA